MLESTATIIFIRKRELMMIFAMNSVLPYYPDLSEKCDNSKLLKLAFNNVIKLFGRVAKSSFSWKNSRQKI